jgi:hypothetical protein
LLLESRTSKSSLALLTPTKKTAEQTEGSKASNQTGARSKDKRKGSGRRSDTNPTSDRLPVTPTKSEVGLLLLRGNKREVDEPSFSLRDNGLAGVERVFLLFGKNRTVGEQSF